MLRMIWLSKTFDILRIGGLTDYIDASIYCDEPTESVVRSPELNWGMAPLSVYISGNPVDVVELFVQLGSEIHSTGSSEPEVRRRIVLVKSCFNLFNRWIGRSSISVLTKVQLYRTVHVYPTRFIITHSLTSRPSSMTVGDCRWLLYCLSSPLLHVLWHILQLNVATTTPLFYVVHPLSFGSSLVT